LRRKSRRKKKNKIPPKSYKTYIFFSNLVNHL
jgi:hypothetical protein